MATDLVRYYSALLISQYQSLPKARATIEALVGEAVGDEMVTKLRTAFDLNSASGEQLDMIGSRIGVSRSVHGAAIVKAYFLLAPYADWSAGKPATLKTGFSFYGGTPQFQSLLRYSDFNLPEYFLNDDDYRRLIKYMAEINTMDLTMENVSNLMYNTFGLVFRESNRVPADHGDFPVIEVSDASEIYQGALGNMVVDYEYYFTNATKGNAFITAVVDNKIFPKAAGVTMTVTSLDRS